MKEAYYFRHDSNARRDQKIIALRLKHKMEGYGIYWAIIELLRESANYMCVTDYNIVAFDLHVSASIVKSIIEEFGLFEFTQDGKHFYSERLLRDMQSRDEISENRRQAINKRWAKHKEEQGDKNSVGNQENNKCDTNEIQVYNTSNTIKEENKKEENIEKNSTNVESKKDNRTAFAPPSLQQVQAYIEEKGYAVDAEHFIDFYTSKGWMVGKNKMKDWQSAVRNWSRKDLNPQQHEANTPNASHRRSGHLLGTDEAKAYDTTF